MESSTAPHLESRQGVRLAVEGCGHGTLDAIYASVEKACQIKGWDGVDALLIGGDFQAVRNPSDLSTMSVPAKYRALGDFPSYYSGAKVAPYLTLFIGGNHEASSHLFELYYGGWVAPNIYYLGAANVVWIGPLRIAGLSGIWKGHDYRKPHHERLPYSYDEVKSIYHVREWDVRKLLLLRSQVDVGLSHDWPQGVEWCGDWKRLFREKSHFEGDARSGKLGSKAAKMVLERLRPPYWFSAHMHVKFAAVVEHKGGEKAKVPSGSTVGGEGTNADGDGNGAGAVEIADGGKFKVTDGIQQATTPVIANEEEIDIDLDDLEDDKPVAALGPKSPAAPEQPNGVSSVIPEVTPINSSTVSEELRAQLPEAFRRELKHEDYSSKSPEDLPFPDAIINRSTKFLALDKCLPGRKFLQLHEIRSVSKHDHRELARPFKLAYDREWLSITRIFAKDLVVGDSKARVSRDQGEAHYRAQIDAEEKWVEENVVAGGRLEVPMNFQVTAPTCDPQMGMQGQHQQPMEYTNPQTSEFCSLLAIPNPFDISTELREERMRRAPALTTQASSSGYERGGRGGRGGRGWRGNRGGRGRGRGGSHN